MTNIQHRLLAALLLFGGLSTAHPTRAETLNTCAGFIDSVPATITTQGVWCLRKDLSTSIASGNAITIATNNVTIDCNGFKLGGLAAGNASTAYGIRAYNRQNTTVRHCSVRGFWYGISLESGAGHLVEDNRLDSNLYTGIHVSGDNNRVRGNAVYDTGGWTGSLLAYGIEANADVVDNTVSGLFADVAGGYLYGIVVSGTGARASGNTVSRFDMAAAQGGVVDAVIGIGLSSARIRASGNNVAGNGDTDGAGIWAIAPTFCSHNTVGGFTTNISPDCSSMNNLTLP